MPAFQPWTFSTLGTRWHICALSLSNRRSVSVGSPLVPRVLSARSWSIFVLNLYLRYINSRTHAHYTCVTNILESTPRVQTITPYPNADTTHRTRNECAKIENLHRGSQLTFWHTATGNRPFAWTVVDRSEGSLRGLRSKIYRYMCDQLILIRNRPVAALVAPLLIVSVRISHAAEKKGSRSRRAAHFRHLWEYVDAQWTRGDINELASDEPPLALASKRNRKYSLLAYHRAAGGAGGGILSNEWTQMRRPSSASEMVVGSLVHAASPFSLMIFG